MAKAEKAKATEKGLATQTHYTQDDIPAMINKLNSQILKIKGGIGEEVKTKGALQGFGKIQDIATVSGLLKAYASVKAREEAYHDAADDVLADSGIKTPTLKIDGDSPSSWMSDIKTRVIIVGRKAELTKLEAAKKILEDNLSASDKLAKSLSDVANMFTEEIE
jgi:hypothetical protein